MRLAAKFSTASERFPGRRWRWARPGWQRARTRPEAFTRYGVLLSYGEAHDDARAALIAQRRAQQIQDWLAGLRRRADIVVTAGT
jgi:hypothetical protein